MSKVKEVLLDYQKVVPFPWTVRKIQKIGRNPTDFLMEVCCELRKCTDIETESGKGLLAGLRSLGMFL